MGLHAHQPRNVGDGAWTHDVRPRAAGLILVAFLMTISACTGSDIASPSLDGAGTSAMPEPSAVQLEPGIDRALTGNQGGATGTAERVVRESAYVSYSTGLQIESVGGDQALDAFLHGEYAEPATSGADNARGLLEFDEAKKCSYLVQVEDSDQGIYSNDELPARIPLAWEQGAITWDESRQELSWWFYPDWLFDTEPRAVLNTFDPVVLWLEPVSDDDRLGFSVRPTEFLVPPTARCDGEMFYFVFEVFDPRE